MRETGGIVSTANAFFTALDQSNTKPWFDENRDWYETAVKAPAKALKSALEADLEALTGAHLRAKVFRINRDLRFSKDKTPYNTHMHLSWTAPSDAAFLLGVSPKYVTVGTGCFAFNAAALKRWRSHVSGPDGAQISAMLAEMAGTGFRVDAPGLKRVPHAYPQDHPNGDLLRHKGLVVWCDLNAAKAERDLQSSAKEAFAALLPVWRLIDNL